MVVAATGMMYKVFNIDKNDFTPTSIFCVDCGYCNRSYMACEKKGVKLNNHTQTTCDTPRPSDTVKPNKNLLGV